MSDSIHIFLSQDHRYCDDQLVQVENFVVQKKWEEALEQFKTFVGFMERHLSWEESILFPAFESKMGFSGGPTFMMKKEHVQLKQCMEEIENSIKNKVIDDYSGNSETLHILLQQHNMKEEQILYPMCDQCLKDDATRLISEMK